MQVPPDDIQDAIEEVRRVEDAVFRALMGLNPSPKPIISIQALANILLECIIDNIPHSDRDLLIGLIVQKYDVMIQEEKNDRNRKP